MVNPDVEFFTWLTDYVYGEGPRGYWKVLRALFSIPFEVAMPRDENRVGDAYSLRQNFASLSGLHARDGLQPTVLEVMIAFAQRLEYDNLHDPDLGDRAPEWFWCMVGAMGLDGFSDNYYNEDRVYEIIQDFVDRRYCKNGRGSLFVIKDPTFDCRRQELWYQAQKWMIENF